MKIFDQFPSSYLLLFCPSELYKNFVPYGKHKLQKVDSHLLYVPS